MGINNTNLRSDLNLALLKYDKNHDGKLTAKEFTDAVKKVDKNNNGLDIKEAKELIGDIELPIGFETPDLSIDELKQLNALSKQTHTMKPNTVIFQMTKDKEKQFKLSDCQKVVALTNKQIPYVADRANTLKDTANSARSIPLVALERIEGGMPKGRLQLSEIYDRAKVAQKHKAGNCAEMACVAFVHARELGAKKVELFSVDNHLFVVVNRKNTSNDDPRAWGDQCMIIDPWSKKSFPASEYFLHKEMKGEIPFLEGPLPPKGDNGVFG